jgi:alkane 1-monooxygenase
MKYLGSFLIPLAAAIGLWFGGVCAWVTVLFVFIGIPLLDALFGRDRKNMDPESEKDLSKSTLHNLMLYAHLPLQISLIGLLGWVWAKPDIPLWVRIGWILSVALSTGGIGITVAHELIHRRTVAERWIGRLLLMTVMYMHFAIEHVRGHHAKVGTGDDPATARQGINVYRFMWLTIPAQFRSAWKLESARLQKQQWRFWSWRNEMLLFGLLQISWLVILGFTFGIAFIPIYLTVALVSVALLEMINYVEHYGLERIQLTTGRYEAVKEHHSWNSDHRISRALLFELTRHSDHHLVATRPYQILRSFEKAPELPSGYPGMLLLTLVPPLWFSVMDPKVEQARRLAVQAPSASEIDG